MICVCRRRCAKRRIREALQIQENYMGQSPKQSVNGIQQNGTNNNHNNNSYNNNKLDTGAPIMNMKSVSMHNVAEDSEDDDDDEIEINDDLKQETQQNTENNTTKHVKKKEKKKKRARMLDLSSDVVENDENQNGNTTSSTNRKYKSKNYGKKDGGSTPIMMDSSIRVQSTETLSNTIMTSSPNKQHPHHIGNHGQQVSFVLDDDIDYYAQVQQMQSNPSDISNVPRSRGGSKLTSSNVKNNDIIDDDDDEDIEYDYGSQM